MGEDGFEIEGMTLFVDGKAVANLTDCKLEGITATYSDEEYEDRGFFGTMPGDELAEINLRASVINTKLLLDMLFGPCKSGRWRLRKRALDMVHLSRMRKERQYYKRLGIDYGQH